MSVTEADDAILQLTVLDSEHNEFSNLFTDKDFVDCWKQINAEQQEVRRDKPVVQLDDIPETSDKKGK